MGGGWVFLCFFFFGKGMRGTREEEREESRRGLISLLRSFDFTLWEMMGSH